MRALLLGNHPDAVSLAVALADAGAWELAAYVGPAEVAQAWQGRGWAVEIYREVEAALALRDLDWVVAGDELPYRSLLLRRALQSEKNVFQVHPADLEPDICYEALLILGDTKKQLAPLLPERATAAFVALGRLLQANDLGRVERVELDLTFAPPPTWETHPLLHLWHGPRLAAGEIQELSVLAAGAEEADLSTPLAISGRFQSGAFFHFNLTPRVQTGESFHFTVKGAQGQVRLELPTGWFGPARLEWQFAQGAMESQEVPATSRQEALLTLGRQALTAAPLATWTDATRALELFSAARRSVRRRRVIVMEYESFGEVGNFKSTMAALGCGVLLLVMVLFFTVPTIPWLKWLIMPLLLLFLGLQMLRWLAREDSTEEAGTRTS
jgi:predicted dehydrogenase